MTGHNLAGRLRDGDLTAAPAVLNLVESRTQREAAAELLTELGTEAAAHVVGVTGPPGAGKSTLLSALVAEWRARGCSVAVLAVDPSSRRSGGALLGDRQRIAHDPGDRSVFIRSMAAGERLGGLAPATRAAARALAHVFDVVVIETVGVGQAETAVADAADTVVVTVQPGAGDVLQFLKSGIMEIPDVLVVTKADLGQVATRARRDLHAALRSLGASDTHVALVSSVPPPAGIDELADAIAAHRERIDLPARRVGARRAGALADFLSERGESGLRALGGRRAAQQLLDGQAPGASEPELVKELTERADA